MSYTHNGAEQQLQLDLASAVSSRSGANDAPLHFCAKKHTVHCSKKVVSELAVCVEPASR